MDNRRGFLRKALGIGAAAGVLALGVPNSLEIPQRPLEQVVSNYQSPSNSAEFDTLWKMMLEYNDVRNDQLVGKRRIQDTIDSWGTVCSYNDKYLGEVDFNTDFNETKDFFERYRKVYDKRPALWDKNTDVLILGNIVDGWNNHFEHDEERLDYRVIIFEQENKSLDQFLKENKEERGKNVRGKISWWDEKNHTAYINKSHIISLCKYIYSNGNAIAGRETADSRESAIKAQYASIMEMARKENPLLFASDEYKTFESEFLKMNINSCEAHERMHHWYPNSEKEAYAAEKGLIK